MNVHAPFAGIFRCQVNGGGTVDIGVAHAIVDATELVASVASPGLSEAHRFVVAGLRDVVAGDLLIEIGENK
ncbi:hypothetical protein [Corynebacterium aurimucosum]|uniref:hypothetical protein n=1 Tax=Corynebacterium aurimucosum TaxID=169292 RepID=UPI00066C88CA|nr:hypothetical protein [Corynebacterium aurimucosum]